MPGRSFLLLFTLVVSVLGPSRALFAAPPAADPFAELGQQYLEQILSLGKKFCLDCHSTQKQEGDLDLERFAAIADIRHDVKTWEKVAEMLDNGEMPPEDATQPGATERQQLRDWVRRFLDAEALASAGDPGPVVLRRLSNVEYTNTVRDLTGVNLDPAREFPVDGAAGEGFTNSGEALVMSPALFDKYLTAAKEIAEHAVLLPDGMRFSSFTSPRDWTDERLTQIRGIYKQFADAEGRAPLDAYLTATIEFRQQPADGKSLSTLADERGLSPKYLESIWTVLNGQEPSCLIDGFRKRWRTATVADIPALVADVRGWQQALTAFRPVGYFKPWQEPVNPLQASQSFRLKLERPATESVTIYLSAADAGDGSQGDAVIWQRPRLEMAGFPTLLLRDLPALVETRSQTLSAVSKYLAAAAEAQLAGGSSDIGTLAARHGLDADVLNAWLTYVGIATSGSVQINGYLTGVLDGVGGYDFVRGWGTSETPSMMTNASDQEVRVPGMMKPRSVAVHPSPTLNAVVGWRSPTEGAVTVTANVADAHPECGNGVAWTVDHRRGTARQKLAAGEINSGGNVDIGPIENVSIKSGDVVCLSIGPRGDHSCDTTRVDLTITPTANAAAKWNLSADVSGNVRDGNPHADGQGNADVWHFFTEPVSGAVQSVASLGVPGGSLLDRWQRAAAEEKAPLADELQRLLAAGQAPPADQPDGVLYQQLTSLTGPLFARIDFAARTVGPKTPTWGADPALYGRIPGDQPVAAASIGVTAPSVVEVRLPAELLPGREFVVDGELADPTGFEGSVQLRVGTASPDPAQTLTPGLPILVREGSAARARIEAGLNEFRAWFPAAVCFQQIVPIDEVVTVELFHRDDEPLSRLLLDDEQQARLNHLWSELQYVSQDALVIEESYVQFMEYTTQDRNPADYEPMRAPIATRAREFRQQLLNTEPQHWRAALDFTSRAYRRPLSDGEREQLQTLYQNLRANELPHGEAIRAVLTRALISPDFLYRLEQPAAGAEPQPISDVELASRLSYFLWASMPDEQLRGVASQRLLRAPDVLAAEARRLLADERVRGLATEFACQWIGVRDFEKFDEKSPQYFPTFGDLRPAMYEESVRFFVELFRRDGSVLDVLNADYTFVNEALASHYGIAGVAGPEFRRVDGVQALDRGGILGMATTLSKQSGASRTSPVLRGNWVVETLLGEKLPKPPKGVPVLPEDETATEGLTVRQLVEKHRSIASCAKCHDRIDAFGFALEGYDAIGRRREKDLGDRPIDTSVTLPDGTQFQGLAGLRKYLLHQRQDQFLRNFCRKLLGYALGRGVQLSDAPLVDEMQRQLREHDYRFSTAVQTIVASRQFQFHRGLAEPEVSQPLNE